MAAATRSLEPAVQDLIEARMRAVVEGTSRAHGAEARLNYQRNYPVTVNAGAQADFAARVAADVVGAPHVDADAPPVMGAEDFSFMLNARPGAFIFVGNGDTAGVHHPAYDFNDEATPYGVSLWAKIIETGMPPAR